MKLIEVAMPLAGINQESKREKSIRHGHPSTLHLWWARRPLAACRAVLFAQLVDDPSTWPKEYPTEQDQDAKRKDLFKIIEEMVKWENGQDEKIMQEARREIAGSLARARKEEIPQTPSHVNRYLFEHAPQIRDPFCGGGAIPLEAQRLGLSVLGSDLNPVAVMVSKATCEIPARFRGLPPVSLKRSQELSLSQNWQKAMGLAEDIDYYAGRMREEAWKQIGHLYPKIRITSDMAAYRQDLKPLVGNKLTVIAWIWARTVASPEPSKRGYHVPLVRSFDLSLKKGRTAWVEPVIHDEAQGFHFAVKTEGTKGPLKGTVTRQGGVCLLSGAAMPFPYIRAEGQAGRMGSRLMAIVAEGRRGRVFLPPTQEMEDLAQQAQPTWKPDALMPVKHRNFQTPLYGMPNIGDLFTDRQLVALTTFSDLIAAVRAEAIRDAEAAGMSRDQTPLADGGAGATAYGDAIATYMALAVDKAADYWSAICSWNVPASAVRNTFARQAIPMIWDYCETNPFSRSSGNWSSCCERISKVIINVPAKEGTSITQEDAAASDQSNLDDSLVFSTDPPYYDNIGYSDLSDYFYVWLRQSLNSIWSNLFSTLQTPKEDELIASPYRHQGRQLAEEFFRSRMQHALFRISLQTHSNFPATIFYAYKQTETDKNGVVSTGWASFLQAIVDTGLSVTGTWPIRTERSGRMLSINTNALASSVVLSCRKRCADAPITTRGQFLKKLRNELPSAIRILQSSDIAPVDLAQAAVGQGMGVFTRYRDVLESDDSSMSVRTALQLINTVLDESLESQDVEYDRQTRFALTWFESFGMGEEPYGEAEKLSVAKDVSVDSMSGTLLNSRGGKVRLLKPKEVGKIEIDDAVWKCAHRIVWLNNEQGELAAAQAMATLSEAKQNAVKDIAYRLYRICENNRWLDLSRDYNGLIASWEGIRLRAQELHLGEQQPLGYSNI